MIVHSPRSGLRTPPPVQVAYHADTGYLWFTYSRETPGIGDNCKDDGA